MILLLGSIKSECFSENSDSSFFNYAQRYTILIPTQGSLFSSTSYFLDFSSLLFVPIFYFWYQYRSNEWFSSLAKSDFSWSWTCDIFTILRFYHDSWWDSGAMSHANNRDVYFPLQGRESIRCEYLTLVARAESHGCSTLYLWCHCSVTSTHWWYERRSTWLGQSPHDDRTTGVWFYPWNHDSLSGNDLDAPCSCLGRIYALCYLYRKIRNTESINVSIQ